VIYTYICVWCVYTFISLAACHMYAVSTVWWCGSFLYVCCVYCVVVWQHVISYDCALCFGVSNCYT